MYVGVYPVAAHDVERSRIGTAIGILFYQECHLFEITGLPAVVGIEKGNILAPCQNRPPVTGRRNPRILLGHETYQRRCITAYNRSTAVGRTVVHNDYFTGQPALSQHRVERRTHFALLVVKRYDDREFNVHRRIFPAAAHRKYR